VTILELSHDFDLFQDRAISSSQVTAPARSVRVRRHTLLGQIRMLPEQNCIRQNPLPTKASAHLWQLISMMEVNATAWRPLFPAGQGRPQGAPDGE